jgi:transcriptional regulator with XRE-family HTH domain
MSADEKHTPVRAFRVKHGLSQKDLAIAFDISGGSVRNYEREKRPKRMVLLALAGLEAELSKRSGAA